MPRPARIAWGLTIVFWCGLYVVTHIPIVPPKIVPVTDKTAHLVAYAALSIALFVAMQLSRKRSPARSAIRVLAILILYAAFDELTQIPVGRHCDILDFYADVTGAAVALVLVTLFWPD